MIRFAFIPLVSPPLKDSAPFIGVKMPIIRKLVHNWHKEQVEGELNYPQQVDLALALFDGEYTEEKLAGTLFLQEILLPAGAVNGDSDIDRFALLFQEGKSFFVAPCCRQNCNLLLPHYW